MGIESCEGQNWMTERALFHWEIRLEKTERQKFVFTHLRCNELQIISTGKQSAGLRFNYEQEFANLISISLM